MALGHGPLIIRLRTGNRTDQVALPSLTPVWRSCEFQEREIFDLFGIQFEGHPDLRRILMWDDFADHPMRKDYVAGRRRGGQAMIAPAPGISGARPAVVLPTTICWKWRWGRIIPPPTACFG